MTELTNAIPATIADPLEAMSSLISQIDDESLYSSMLYFFGHVRAEVEGYRQATCERFTEARITGVTSAGRKIEQVYTQTDHHDPITSALADMVTITDGRMEWDDAPTLEIRDAITTAWTEYDG